MFFFVVEISVIKIKTLGNCSVEDNRPAKIKEERNIILRRKKDHKKKL